MQTLNNVHQQFAEFFKSETLKPFTFLVSKKLSEGHICIKIKDAADELQDSPFYDVNTDIADTLKLKEEPLVSEIGGRKQPFILHNGRLYLQRYFNYETQILNWIKKFVESETGEIQKRMNAITSRTSFIQSLFTDFGFTPGSSATDDIEWQLIAAVSAVLNNFTIITGGPGTGKTTTVAKILAILFTLNPDLKVALAAPTGKAAVRMAESLKASSENLAGNVMDQFKSIIPGTIHRLLKYVPGSPYFQHNKDNPINYDVVVIDESSMIDVALFAKLLDAIGPQTRLILLGDKDQLASVEAGSLFGDLCKASLGTGILSEERVEMLNSFIESPDRKITSSFIAREGENVLNNHIIELKKSHRFSTDTGIGKFSKAIIKNDEKELLAYVAHNQDDQVTIDTTYNNELFEQFIEGYSDYIKEPDIKKALQKINCLRVLCAVREGEHGLYSLNTAIENYLRKKKLITRNSEYYENRPIIITKNYYSLGLFNGDVGIIRADENGVLKAWFEDSDKELKSVLPGYVAESETVFAMTIHKSQGSEYDKVLVVLPNNVNIQLLTRELLYTAVTRAKAKIVLQAGEAVIMHTAAGAVERASGILERFNEPLDHKTQ